VRYERKIKTAHIVGVSLESPKADYQSDSLPDNVSDYRNLDLAGRYKYFSKWGHVQVAGILRLIDVFQQDRMDVEFGWGILLSSTINIRVKHKINAQFSGGKGIAHYYVGFTDRQLDAVYNPNTNKMVLKGIYGGFINYSYWYSPKLVFSVITGASKLSSEEFEPGDTFESSMYYGANIFYNPIETISLGLEVSGGTRKNTDNQKGDATRISMLAKFDF
jgi:hypothetical protein